MSVARTVKLILGLAGGLAILAMAPTASLAASQAQHRVQPNTSSNGQWHMLGDSEVRKLLIRKYGAQAARKYQILHVTPWLGADQLTGWMNDTNPVWAGYMDSLYYTLYYANEVAGTMTVPYHYGKTPVIAEWAGIGGYYGSKTLVQAGTTSTFYNGNPVAATFVECYPANPINLWVVTGGMTVSVSLYLEGTANWSIIVTDSDYESEGLNLTCAADQNSAEWIMERAPQGSSGAIPSNIGTQTFSYDTWVNDSGDGVERSIQDSEVGTIWQMTLRDTNNKTNECLVPGGLGPYYSGSIFHVSYASSC